MHGRRRVTWSSSALLAIVGGLTALVLAGSAAAQLKSGTAEIKAVTGRVEVEKKGDTQWLPAVVGAKLVEGDNIRAWAGGSARLDLPDGSTIFLAENSRLAVRSEERRVGKQGTIRWGQEQLEEPQETT